MKIKEAIEMLNQQERLELQNALDTRRLGNPADLSKLYSACLILRGRKLDWMEVDLSLLVHPQKLPETNIAYLRTRTTALVKYIEKFLMQKAFENDPVMQGQCLLRELRVRNWGSNYLLTYKKVLNDLDLAPLQSFEQHAARLAIMDDFLLSSPLVGHDFMQPLFQKSLDSLDRAYALKKLSLACKAKSQDRDRETNHTLQMEDGLIAWIATMDPEKEPLIHLYSLLYGLITDREGMTREIYFMAKKHLWLHWEVLRKDQLAELQDVFTYLINYCVLCVNQGKQAFKKELVELYDWLLLADILERNGKLSARNFRNAFVVLSLSDDQAALKRLMTKYGKHVEGATAESTVLLCEGYHAYRQKKYDKAQLAFVNSLRRLPLHADYKMEAEAMAMLARIAYQQGDYREVLDQLRLLSIMLKKGRLSDSITKSFKLFATLLGQLAKVSQSANAKRREDIEILVHQLDSSSKKVFAKDWLLGIAKGLVKKHVSPPA